MWHVYYMRRHCFLLRVVVIWVEVQMVVRLPSDRGVGGVAASLARLPWV